MIAINALKLANPFFVPIGGGDGGETRIQQQGLAREEQLISSTHYYRMKGPRFESQQSKGLLQDYETQQTIFRRLARERRLKKINQEIFQWYESLSPEERQKVNTVADEYLAMTEEQRDKLWDDLYQKAYAELKDQEEIELTSEFVPARQRRD